MWRSFAFRLFLEDCRFTRFSGVFSVVRFCGRLCYSPWNLLGTYLVCVLRRSEGSPLLVRRTDSDSENDWRSWRDRERARRETESESREGLHTAGDDANVGRNFSIGSAARSSSLHRPTVVAPRSTHTHEECEEEKTLEVHTPSSGLVCLEQPEAAQEN